MESSIVDESIVYKKCFFSKTTITLTEHWKLVLLLFGASDRDNSAEKTLKTSTCRFLAYIAGRNAENKFGQIETEIVCRYVELIRLRITTN